MYLLDTTAVSELRKLPAGRANAGVAAWSATVRPSDLHVSVITLQELAQGVLTMERRDPAQGAILRRWLDGQVVPGFRDRALPVDAAVAFRCAALHVPDRRPALDALIAATALVHGLTVVTRNLSDFRPMGVPLLDPWT